MTNQQPITPPPELRRQWLDNDHFSMVTGTHDLITITRDRLNSVMDQSARWGADQELESCIELLKADGYKALASPLRAARRPKPPSLKEQALTALDDAVMRGDCITISDALPTLRRALEALND